MLVLIQHCVMRHVGLTIRDVLPSLTSHSSYHCPVSLSDCNRPLFPSCGLTSVAPAVLCFAGDHSPRIYLLSSSRPSQLLSSFSAPLVLLSSSRPSQLPSSSALLVLLSSALILFFSTLTVLVSALSSSCSFFSLSPHPRTMFDGSLPTRAPCLMALFPPAHHV